jgi:hypothetical protein
MAPAKPSILPNSPSQPLSEQLITLSNAQEFVDMVKAVVAIQIASSPAPKYTCSHTPPGDPSESSSTDLCLPTPHHTFPTTQPLHIVTTEHIQQFLDILKSLSTKQGPPPLPAKPSGKSGKPKARASKLEFKTINKVYIFKYNTSLYILI